MSESPQGFKRINFFKGFLTTEKDWNDAERYHIDKRRLHNRMLHSPGVVYGYQGDLRVTARTRGDLAVEVQAGYAIDGLGNDLLIYDAAIRNINLDDFKLPQTIYVVLRFYEELTDFIAYKENLEYKGHRRVLESCRVELSQTEPDIFREVELARIYLEKGVNRIRDARDPQNPTPNEIDMRYVPRGGHAGSTLPGFLRHKLDHLLMEVRRAGVEYTRRGVVAGHDVVQSCNTALMLMYANLVDLRNVFDMFRLIIDTQSELALEVDAHHPQIAAKKEFSEFRRHVEVVRGLLGENKNNTEAFQNLLAYQGKTIEIALTAVGDLKPVLVVPEEKKLERVAELRDWDAIKVVPQPQPQVTLEGTVWVLVDEIEILNRESEDKHIFTIKEAKDSYRSRQKLKYPDGTTVEDNGRAHVDGYSEFKLLNISPGKPVVILRRMDYVYGDYELELSVNGKKAGVVSCTGTDRVHRWRNWPAMIGAENVKEGTMLVRQQSITAGRDINMFHIWVYQPK